MKVLPYITFAVCVGFLVFQQFSLSAGDKRNAGLKTQITEVKASGGANRAGEGASGARVGAKSSRTGKREGGTGAVMPTSLADLDLEELAKARMEAERGGIPNLKAMMMVQSLLLEATPEELAALIKRTAESDLSDEFKRDFIGEVVGSLADEDPRVALELAFSTDYASANRGRGNLSRAYSKWVKEDPVAAIAWFDRELAKGSFESKSLDGEQNARQAFEASAVNALLESNPDLARQRLAALPEDVRAGVFARGVRSTPETAVAHARVLREVLPADQHAEMLADANRDFLRRRDYQELVEYTTEIGATDEERTAIVQAAVERKFERFGWDQQTPTAEDVSGMQEFLQTQIPEEANTIAGQTLSRFGRSRENFEQAVELVQEAHRAAPNDDILVGFLSEFSDSSVSTDNQSSALTLAEQITDPERREEILDRFGDRDVSGTVEE